MGFAESKNRAWLRYWPHLISGVVLAFMFAIPTPMSLFWLWLGYFLTEFIYRGYIVVSYLLLILPATPLLRSILPRSTQGIWWALDVSLCTFILSQGLKFLIHWPRPSGSPTGSISGHTAYAIALAWLISVLYPRLGPLWFALAVAIGWSRVEVQAHYAYQIPLGGLLGAFIGWAIIRQQQGIILPRYLNWRSSHNPKYIPTSAL